MIQEFIQKISGIHRRGNATELSYCPALKALFEPLARNIVVLNEPKRENVGAPDFSISCKDTVIGHCKAKDLGIDLQAIMDANAGQKKRFVGGPQNLLHTKCGRGPRAG